MAEQPENQALADAIHKMTLHCLPDQLALALNSSQALLSSFALILWNQFDESQKRDFVGALGIAELKALQYVLPPYSLTRISARWKLSG